MNIVMSGATGFIGSHLGKAFRNKGWNVVPLRREEMQLDDQAVKK